MKVAITGSPSFSFDSKGEEGRLSCEKDSRDPPTLDLPLSTHISVAPWQTQIPLDGGISLSRVAMPMKNGPRTYANNSNNFYGQSN